jgi:hypothetical protein
MGRKVDEGVVGGALAIVLSATGLIVLALTPLAAVPSEYEVAVVGSAMIVLACLGAGMGVAITRLATHPPANGPAADYDDQPPAG